MEELVDELSGTTIDGYPNKVSLSTKFILSTFESLYCLS